MSGIFKLLWDGGKNKHGILQEKGWGEAERKRLIGLIANEQNGGISIDKAVHRIIDLYGQEFNLDYDRDIEVKEALLAALQSMGTKGDAHDMVRGFILSDVKDELVRRGEGDIVSREEQAADARAEAEKRAFIEDHPEYEGASDEEIIKAMEGDVEIPKQGETLPNEEGVSDETFEQGEDDYVPFRDGEGEGDANEVFNNQLEAFKNNTHKGNLQLGKPSPILRASGINSTEMFITPKTLKDHLKKHGLTVDDIKNLPKALETPFMVYEWGTKNKSMICITELETTDGRKITAAIKLERNGNKVEVNEIASVHGKEAERMLNELIDEDQNKVHGGVENAIKYIKDKAKALDWLGLDPPKGSATLTKQELSIAKIIKEHENKSIEEEKNDKTTKKDELFRQQEPVGEHGVKKVTKVREAEYRDGTDYFGNPKRYQTRSAEYKVEGMDDTFHSVEEAADAVRRRNPDYCVYVDNEDNIRLEAWSNLLPEGVRPNSFAKVIAMSGGDMSNAMKERIAKYTEREMAQARNQAEAITKELGLDVEFHDDPNEFEGRKRKAKGWYDPKTGKIHVVMGNHSGVGDVMATMLHEGVAHHGLRKLFGSDFDTFLDNVHDNVGKEIRAEIDGRIEKMRADAEKNGESHSDDYYRRAATEEYIADLSEDGLYNAEKHSSYAMRAWKYIKKKFLELIRGKGFNMSIGDDELRYTLWKSHQNLRQNAVEMAKDAVLREKAGIKNYVEEGEPVRKVAEGEVRYGEGENSDINLSDRNNLLNLQPKKNCDNNAVQEPISQRVGGAQDALAGSLGEKAVRFTESSRALKEAVRRAKGSISKREEWDIESRVAEQWAKENNHWLPYNDVDSLGVWGPPGNEHYTYIKDGWMYKVNTMTHTPSIEKLLNRLSLYNKYFPSTAYTLEGFTGFDGRSIYPILKQRYVGDAEHATQKEIDSYMEKIGFEKTEDVGTFTNGEHVISDLFPKNVMRNEEGDLFVVDAEIKDINDPSPFFRDGEGEPRDFGAELRELMYRRLRGEDVTAELEQLRADREAARRAAESAEVRTENGGAGSDEPPVEPPTPPTPEPAPELPPTGYDRPRTAIEQAQAADARTEAEKRAFIEDHPEYEGASDEEIIKAMERERNAGEDISVDKQADETDLLRAEKQRLQEEIELRRPYAAGEKNPELSEAAQRQIKKREERIAEIDKRLSELDKGILPGENGISDDFFEQGSDEVPFQKVKNTPRPPRPDEVLLRDGLVQVLRDSGIDVVTDETAGLRELEAAKRAAEILNEMKKNQSQKSRKLDSYEEEKANITDISDTDGAKVLQKIETLAKKYEKKSNNPRTFLDDLAITIGARKGVTNKINKKTNEVEQPNPKSKYADFITLGGQKVTIRLANHNATAKHFDDNGELEGISIVVSGVKDNGIKDNGNAHIVEFYYSEKDLFSRENPDIRYHVGEGEARDFGAELRELMYRRLRGEDVTAELEQLRADREAARRAAESAEVRTENGGAGSDEVPFQKVKSTPRPPRPDEVLLRDGLVQVLRDSGIDVVTDETAGLRELEAAKRAAEILNEMKKRNQPQKPAVGEESPLKAAAISETDAAKVAKDFEKTIEKSKNAVN